MNRMTEQQEKTEQQAVEKKQLTLEELAQVTGGSVASLAGLKIGGEYKSRSGFEAGADYER